jgi:hypothetical protein
MGERKHAVKAHWPAFHCRKHCPRLLSGIALQKAWLQTTHRQIQTIKIQKSKILHFRRNCFNFSGNYYTGESRNETISINVRIKVATQEQCTLKKLWQSTINGMNEMIAYVYSCFQKALRARPDYWDRVGPPCAVRAFGCTGSRVESQLPSPLRSFRSGVHAWTWFRNPSAT